MTCRKREDSFEFKGCGIAFDFSVPTEGCADGGAKESLNWGGRNPQGRREAEKLEACRKHWYTPVFTSNLGEGGKG